ncbi:MAG: hypothetical protein CFE21_01090 [Bacteroidetes bacterium B1(2017)]|nr:MAG: hypothetical protein CFE21_01090 [Bacteroidetes bacterium B1(2017)]
MKFAVFIILILLIKNVFYIYRRFSNLKQQASYLAPTIDQTVPDTAISFGYKCIWFAIKTTDKNRIAELLKLENLSECNWQVGIEKAYQGDVFISPPIDNWTFAMGWGLPHGDSIKGIGEVKNILQTLSKEFGEAQFFSTHRVSEYHCWMKASNGKVERVYSYLGESGENIVIEGQPTEFEQKLNLVNTFSDEAKGEKYLNKEDIDWPTEQLLMQVAENWSIDPTTLEERKDITPSLGLLGQG